jgi:hypothetical protein
MYNYAAYGDEYAAASSTTSERGSEEYDEQPVAKRRRGMITDSDAKKLIQQWEADTMNLAMPDQLDIVDARVDSHLGNVRENLIRNITTTPASNLASAMQEGIGSKKSRSKDGKPNDLAKRKHQITYLAFLVSYVHGSCL